MGIPGFFKWLTNKDYSPSIAGYCVEYEPYYDEHGVFHAIDDTQSNPNGIEFDNLYLDMNGIIHSSINLNHHFQPKNEDEIIKSIFDCIDRIFSIVRPRRLLYMAIDGVAPRAKLNQQRSRRILALQDSLDTIKEREERKAKILASGNALPDDSNQQEKIELIDENCLTPGTSFMMHLSNCLRYYIYNRMNTNSAWTSIKVILSDANVPGEGEHKIIDFIRKQRTQSSYNPYTRHVLFGNDADLIVLGIATHEQYITIMRDEFNPWKPRFCSLCQQIGHDFKGCKGISKENLSQSDGSTASASYQIDTKYMFLDLSTLCNRLFECLSIDYQSVFPWDGKRFLDDWVFICLLVGNDFLPDIPSLEIYENAIDDLLTIYAQNVPELNDYLTDNGILNVDLLRKMLVEFGTREDEKFKTRHQINQTWLSHNRPTEIQTKPLFNQAEINAQREVSVPMQFRPSYGCKSSSSPTNKSTEVKSSSQVSHSSSLISSKKQELSNLSVLNGPEEFHDPEDTIRLWEEGWHERYYQNKFNVDKDHWDERRKEIVEDYTRGLQWVLQYYYRGVPSWDWYYPHYYAPFASDFAHSRNRSVSFNENSKPFKPLEQLISVLPAPCAKYLPEKWQRLVLGKDSPIIDFYPSSFPIDSNGKRYKSQYTALLPFIDDKHLHQVLEEHSSLLTSEENQRNEVKNDLLFIHTKNSDYMTLKQRLDGSSGSKVTYENPVQIPARIQIPGYIWPDSNDDKVILIEKSIKAPLANYKHISNNQVMCVEYRR